MHALLLVVALAGHVVDSTKAPLPGVTVEATPAGGGSAKVAATGHDGAWTLEVAPGKYDVAFRLINFATSVKRGVVAGSGTTNVDAMLYLSSSSEVVVTAKQTFRNVADLDEPVNDLIGIADAARRETSPAPGRSASTTSASSHR